MPRRKMIKDVANEVRLDPMPVINTAEFVPDESVFDPNKKIQRVFTSTPLLAEAVNEVRGASELNITLGEVSDFIASENLNFFLGNVVKYVCRSGEKSVFTGVQNLEIAAMYLNREIERLKSLPQTSTMPLEDL